MYNLHMAELEKYCEIYIPQLVRIHYKIIGSLRFPSICSMNYQCAVLWDAYIYV